ncbi:hypothetical protein NHX12_028060 [Muraenolepis orangiensis]|uniref:Metalloendopeptidase n=1 Tax=Muraenolepis orangiensis TaxID=630683 RepID=A0A9Q0EK95_9TELE|nr:hypothetical protein NHX12_028060 [Muraenolepis orangiensis]
MYRDCRGSSCIMTVGRGFLAQFITLLKTYNGYLKENTQHHLCYCQDNEGGVALEGFLNISWGVHRPIRLKIQDDKQTIPFASLMSPDPGQLISPLDNKSGMTRWGEYSNLHHIDEMSEMSPEVDLDSHQPAGPRIYESTTLKHEKPKPLVLEVESNLFRCMSDASLVKRRRGRSKSAAQRELEKQHRFSINGHYYNYKIENDPQDFALYCLHQTGEKKKLIGRDQPLWERFLHGPSEDIMKVFLMETDEQEVSNDVAQYLNLELPILEQVLLKITEAENREVHTVITKYRHQHSVMSHMLSSQTPPIETSRNALKCSSDHCRWGKSSSGLVEVPYIIDDYFYGSEKLQIRQAMEDFHKKTCIRFVPHSGQTDYLNIISKLGCWSGMGRAGGRQDLSLSVQGCMHRGVIQHEILHALGFYHEHTRSDRDRHVRINWDNVPEGSKYNFMKSDTNNLDTPYDYTSVMHYSRTAFSSRFDEDTITPVPDPSVEVGQRGQMSRIDILRINKLYKC